MIPATITRRLEQHLPFQRAAQVPKRYYRRLDITFTLQPATVAQAIAHLHAGGVAVLAMRGARGGWGVRSLCLIEADEAEALRRLTTHHIQQLPCFLGRLRNPYAHNGGRYGGRKTYY